MKRNKGALEHTLDIIGQRLLLEKGATDSTK